MGNEGVVADPLHQFEIQRYIPLQVGDLDLSFTNSALFMVLAVLLSAGLLIMGMRGRAMVPGRLQSMAEILYEFVADMVRENAGPQARRYFPFIFSLFIFILFGNLLGLIPTAFTFTSHIIVTFALAMVVFVFVTILAFARHGLHFFHFFLPEGTPGFIAPLIIPIEVISYFVRPISLSIRLFANMLAGHTMLKVFAGFSVTLAGLGGIGYAAGLIPVALNVALFGLEFLVACIQAYVFALLSCVYLRDALELH
ncbi:F0F1 ATP synthase subunit A [Aerophototrophica crusticola]|uniref:ATP synthase subunit a n=1 Tax=Aerophototrophica crusticola TaxID=1709002 RepID=A0A858R3S4_9PROT|nr:F0F1 ATP synthase subunit A [Rhodospirillaceae bacterium B3]